MLAGAEKLKVTKVTFCMQVLPPGTSPPGRQVGKLDEGEGYTLPRWGERLARSTSRRGAAAYGDAHMVGTCRGAAGAERPPAAERRLTVWPICCLEGSFPYKKCDFVFCGKGEKLP